MQAVTPARRSVAFLLGAVVSGWGLFYVGRPRLAATLIAVLWSCLLIGGWSGLFTSRRGVLVLVAIIIVTKCVSAFAGAWFARHRIKVHTKRDHFFFLAAMAVSLWLLTQPSPRSLLLGIEGYRVQGNGMAPTLMKGDAVVCDSRHRDYSLGDVVAYEREGNIEVKRIAATEGNSIEIIDGNVLLNGENFGPFHSGGAREKSYSQRFERTQIPRGYVFMLGDNRDNSRDSRSDGPVALASVRCKTTEILYSAERRKTGTAIW
ncbi:MAG: signal peptidase [Pseudomonas sp.]|nr:signal peptidase [Pseudomonas sp.]